ncbi:MAG TPA: VOC family protein [Actinopolymorphaceae bacterium]|jgi:4a-hydroxytetrahydrobiopterin dehydratase
MADTLKAADVSARPELTDWRFMLNRIEAEFHAGSFDAAGRFVAQIGELAQAADHHPNVDLRYPDLVHVVLSSHSDGGVTEKDVALATSISELAATSGYGSEPLSVRSIEIGIDALDIDLIRPFWRAVLAYEDGPSGEGEQPNDLFDPAGIGPSVWFQQMDAPRPQRNRIHFDVTVPHDVAEQRIADAIAAGGHITYDAEAPAFVVLADAEGNEACVCTWQNRENR